MNTIKRLALAGLWAIALLVMIVTSWRADPFCGPGGDQATLATCYRRSLPGIWALGIAVVLTQLWLAWATPTSRRARAWL
jgi:hypothetical protein